MSEQEWLEAKKKCRLWDSEIQMAKELKIKPLTLIHNLPSAKERWKEQPGLWIRRMYEKRLESAGSGKKRDETPAEKC